MDAAEDRTDPKRGDPGAVASDRSLQRVAHDINGALNSLALNIELLDRATAFGSAADDEARAAARERCLAALRRAVAEIQQIVAHRLSPAAGGSIEVRETS